MVGSYQTLATYTAWCSALMDERKERFTRGAATDFPTVPHSLGKESRGLWRKQSEMGAPDHLVALRKGSTGVCNETAPNIYTTNLGIFSQLSDSLQIPL